MMIGPIARIYARYAIGIVTGALVVRGLLPQEVANILNQDATVTAISSGFLAGSAYVVEKLYAKAKARGWSL
jgi:pantothenate kinase type III